jgi:hypothetical protein
MRLTTGPGDRKILAVTIIPDLMACGHWAFRQTPDPIWAVGEHVKGLPSPLANG